MITAIQEIGAEILGKNSTTDPALLLAQDPNSSTNYPMMLLIELETTSGDTNQFVFKRVGLEETKSKGFETYLYRRRGANGANYTPTCLITGLEKTWKTRVLSWFTWVEGLSNKLSADAVSYFSGIQAALLIANEVILEESTKILNSSKASFGITLKVDNQKIGEISFFKEAMVYLVNEKDLEVSASGKLCSVCGANGVAVIGNLNVFKFYTMDKPGFIAGNFREDLAWRNYPVCLNCKSAIEEGKNYLEKNMRFSFYGLNYLLIPKFLFHSEGNEYISKMIEKWKNKISIADSEMRNRLTNDEAEILRVLSEETNQLQFDLLFLFSPPGSSAERIFLHLEDVTTYRLKALFDAKTEVEALLSLSDKSFYSFAKIRSFFSKSDEGKRDNDLNKYFLEVVNHCFTKTEIDYRFFFPFFMKRIRSVMYEEGFTFSNTVRDAVMNLHYFERIGLFKPVKEAVMVEDRYAALIQKYGNNLDSGAKQGIFLLGGLTQMLLDFQKEDRDATPFLKQLKGFKMNQQDVLGLVPKIIDKLNSYKIYGARFKELAESLIERFLIESIHWKMSIDEINFYFVSGMSLSREIKEVFYKKKEDLSNDKE
ncbi:TIGR02556 family CRISPR-associated protein [Paenibacillus alginolyticus]|uniref:TIGR02556 family CRISPR-associated protein n=1 Tax=Paenibacillus alginolyticus TaxID=59839 RepID=A0ABT4G7G4_9BACL|nr:TIGR02556 family CRISPR-associated protein [Paenibacillus alginolyticus]MCY9692095.1 TIGR02556 family CRISPR-associated protein [Paenibacillus alginolyticus]MEC0147860.1 TIGR02556 family CRISPR-associated protein [Paenibacillus alginolyticus]